MLTRSSVRRSPAIALLLLVLGLLLVGGRLLMHPSRTPRAARLPAPAVAPMPAPASPTPSAPLSTPTAPAAPIPARTSPGVSTPPASPSPAHLTVSVLDVGQGDAILVQFPNRQSMLIDAGDLEHGDTVVQALRARGLTRMDVLVVTHPHEDHLGGVSAVMAAFPNGRVWDSGYNHGTRLQERFLQTIQTQHIRYGTPRAGFQERFGTTLVEVLAPARLISGTESDANNNSLVLRISEGAVSFLLTGDMQQDERKGVTWPRTTVLKVAHHGSRDGTDTAFLRQVAPQVAVISCGRQNDYGHPHRETVEALRASGARLYTTAEVGTVTFTTDGTTLTTRVSAQSSQPAPPAPPTVSPAPTQPPVPEADAYIGNARSKVFHRATCDSLPAERHRVSLASRDQALAEGYRPCGRCKP